MIDVYFWITPNGYKVTILLEELGWKYNVIPVNIGKGEQFKPEFLKISPNNRIPAIVDHDGPGGKPIAMFESGAIMMYLAEKSGFQFMPAYMRARYDVTQWLMFQMAGIGPMMGQANVFYRYFPEKLPAAIQRYHNECRRLFEVLEGQLKGREFLCDEYSIADIANWCWVRIYEWSGVNIEGLTNLRAWIDRLEARPACQRGIAVPEPLVFKEPTPEMLKTAQSLVTR